jgi:hypothetical protein
MNDKDDLARLRACDPARDLEPTNMGELRERVMKAIAAPGTPTSRAVPQGKFRVLRSRLSSAPVMALVAASLVVSSGTGGLVLGRASLGESPGVAMIVSQMPAMGSGGLGTSESLGEPGRPGSVDGMAPDSNGDRSFGMLSATLLEPSEDLPNRPGEAAGYHLDPSGVDRTALAKRLAKLIGATGSLSNSQGNLSISSNDGYAPNLWVSSDSQVSFSAYTHARSLWTCNWYVTESAPEPGEPMTTKPSSGGGSSGSGADTDEPSPDREYAPSPILCEGQKRVEGPTVSSAIATARQAFQSLGLNTQNLTWTATQNGLATEVRGVFMVQGQALQLGWSAEISSLGVYSLSGFAAELTELATYRTVGARTAALRSHDPRWSQFGPQYIWGSHEAAPSVRTPTSSTGTAAPQVDPQQPSADSAGLGSALRVPINIVTVTSATVGLMQYWIDGRLLILPTWEFTDTSGNRWAMVAIADEYVTFVPAR